MLIYYNQNDTKNSLNYITELHGKHSTMLMDFALLQLNNESYRFHTQNKELALLLMTGEATLKWENSSEKIKRTSLLDEAPITLHCPCDTEIHIEAHGKVEFALQLTENNTQFTPLLYNASNIRNEYFGKGSMQNTSTRNVRTIFDAATAPHSNMVIGEVVNYPGKWSSYPPHNHPQPEVYHYRFFPEHGFGYGEVGDAIYKLKHKSTLLIEPWVTHPQCAAPGYAMYYIWMIPHIKDAKFGPDSRMFVDEHKWLLDPDADIWQPPID